MTMEENCYTSKESNILGQYVYKYLSCYYLHYCLTLLFYVSRYLKEITMDTSIVTVKGQLVVPAKIRRKFGIKKGTKIAFVEQNGKLMIQPLDKNYFEDLAGILGTDGDMLKGLMEDKKKEREL